MAGSGISAGLGNGSFSRGERSIVGGGVVILTQEGTHGRAHCELRRLNGWVGSGW